MWGAALMGDKATDVGIGHERLRTGATVITAVRTIASGAVAAWAVHDRSLTLLVVALGVYWVGDMLDGAWARVRGCETRIGAVLDIFSDRFNAGAFYLGLAWLEPELAPAVFVYLAEFMVVDSFLSLAFLAWPIRSPNYFYVVDRQIWLWNWSKPAKAVNSALFAVLLLVTGWMWLGLAIALVLLAMKSWSLARLLRLGLPVPTAPSGADRSSGSPHVA
ncbi:MULTISPECIES: CDP-alcohol phosphatidyltransferase family protein [unclassified Knoellia]|uniref:CDP-alcohol phosphatidyltransferase family protein n=1 Tax=Knoellia altitudinis TaxID=3404795 RepID=UPI00360E5473